MRDSVTRTPEGIKLHTQEDFEGMRKAGRLAAEALDMIGPHVEPGVTTDALNTLIHEFILDHGAVPAPLDYKGFPKSCCISINEVVCHGIPGKRTLKERDILNIDVTCILDGWHGDTSRMYTAGEPKKFAKRLIDVTHETLMRGLAVIKEGTTFAELGRVMQTYAEGEKCSVVREFCGHGLGEEFHEPPNILHYEAGPGEQHFNLQQTQMRAGMFFTVEPMVNIGKRHTKVKNDGWTAVTKDGLLSAQFEHTLAVTKDGCEIFTLSPAGLFHPNGPAT